MFGWIIQYVEVHNTYVRMLTLNSYCIHTNYRMNEIIFYTFKLIVLAKVVCTLKVNCCEFNVN